MYCKNCGKKLPDNARFCDRCNMSVRKKEDKRDLIGELKEERLARRQAKVVEERLKKIKKVKHKRYKNVAGAAVLILLIGIISMLIGWTVIYDPDTNDNQENNFRTETTAAPTQTPKIIMGGTSPVQTAVPITTPTSTASPVTLNSDGYYITDIGGIKVAYPRMFKDYESKKENILSLCDVTGEAVLVVGKTITSAEPKDLMEKYVSGMGGEIMESRAGDKEYEISLMIGKEIYHKKSCVINGTEFYYEIHYPSDSTSRQQYIEDIEYMDTFLSAKE